MNDKEKDIYIAASKKTMDTPLCLSWRLPKRARRLIRGTEPAPNISKVSSNAAIYPNHASIHSLIKKYDVSIMKLYILQFYQTQVTFSDFEEIDKNITRYNAMCT